MLLPRVAPFFYSLRICMHLLFFCPASVVLCYCFALDLLVSVFSLGCVGSLAVQDIFDVFEAVPAFVDVFEAVPEFLFVAAFYSRQRAVRQFCFESWVRNYENSVRAFGSLLRQFCSSIGIVNNEQLERIVTGTGNSKSPRYNHESPRSDSGNPGSSRPDV